MAVKQVGDGMIDCGVLATPLASVSVCLRL
jgi:hypothetical protein